MLLTQIGMLCDSPFFVMLPFVLAARVIVSIIIIMMMMRNCADGLTVLLSCSVHGRCRSALTSVSRIIDCCQHESLPSLSAPARVC